MYFSIISDFLNDVTFETTFNWYLKVLKLVGFWPSASMKGWKLLLYHFYTAFSFTFLLGTYILIQTIDLYKVRGDIPAMTADAFLLFTNLVHTFKIANILVKQKSVLKIIDALKNLTTFQVATFERQIIRSYAIIGLRDVCLYFCLTYVVLTLWIIGPLTSQSDNTRELPLKAWYPYNKTKSPAYEMTYMHQSIAIYIAAGLNVIKDSLVVGLINQTTCQMAILRFRLEHIADFVKMLPFTIKRKRHNVTSKLNDDVEESLFQKLKCCIIHHQKILNIISEIESCYTYVILTQFTVSLVIICVSAFQMAMQIGSSIVQLLGIGLYLLTMIYQVFTYCWHGNEIIIQSKEIMVSAYSCDWNVCSPRFKNALRLMMLRSVYPVQLTAGGFSTLSIETFTAIMKASYSFFTVLKQVNDPAI